MVAVVDAPALIATLAQVRLSPFAVNVIEQDGPRTLSKAGACAHCHSQTTLQLSAHNIGIHHVPVIITHRAPCTIVLNLDTALTTTPAIYQPH